MTRHHALLLALPLFATGLSGCAPLVATGVGATVVMADDRRTPATYIMDEEIEITAQSRLREQKLEGIHANFTSFNRRLLITGEAPRLEWKNRVASLANGVPNVREVIDDLAVMEPSGYSDRANDSYITAKVKARLLDDPRVNPSHVKVVTERNVTYLMGLVKRAEAQAAAEVAATTAGVERVVKAFEYLD